MKIEESVLVVKRINITSCGTSEIRWNWKRKEATASAAVRVVERTYTTSRITIKEIIWFSAAVRVVERIYTTSRITMKEIIWCSAAVRVVERIYTTSHITMKETIWFSAAVRVVERINTTSIQENKLKENDRAYSTSGKESFSNEYSLDLVNRDCDVFSLIKGKC